MVGRKLAKRWYGMVQRCAIRQYDVDNDWLDKMLGQHPYDVGMNGWLDGGPTLDQRHICMSYGPTLAHRTRITLAQRYTYDVGPT